MNRMMRRNMAVLLVTAILLVTPTMALADGGAEDGYVATANGYQVELVFKEPVMAGENEFHIQITDSMGMPVPNAEVEVSAMPSEGMTEHGEDEEMATEAPSVGVMTSNNTMDGMDMATEAPSTGVMKPNEPAADEHGEEALTVMLEPTAESGEYAGELHFETSGEWMFNVHFTVNGETTEVDFQIEIARTLGLNYAVLAGFFGINGTVIAAAAFLKRKPVVVRK
ncbi:MAG: FixH family protein [Chloroflexi bacterium]|nr:FixH family protein [Chloroflexota bacterium]